MSKLIPTVDVIDSEIKEIASKAKDYAAGVKAASAPILAALGIAPDDVLARIRDARQNAKVTVSALRKLRRLALAFYGPAPVAATLPLPFPDDEPPAADLPADVVEEIEAHRADLAAEDAADDVDLDAEGNPIYPDPAPAPKSKIRRKAS